MRNAAWVGIVGMFFFGAAIRVALHGKDQNVEKPFLEKRVTRTFDDAGIQIELPVATPSTSSSTNGLLIMLHPTRLGEVAEQGYCVKIYVRRLSKRESDSNGRVASNPLTDEFNKWYTKSHRDLDIKKLSKLWHIRKDVPTPTGLTVFIDCELTVTKSVDADLAETKRIVESLKPLR